MICPSASLTLCIDYLHDHSPLATSASNATSAWKSAYSNCFVKHQASMQRTHDNGIVNNDEDWMWALFPLCKTNRYGEYATGLRRLRSSARKNKHMETSSRLINRSAQKYHDFWWHTPTTCGKTTINLIVTKQTVLQCQQSTSEKD